MALMMYAPGHLKLAINKRGVVSVTMFRDEPAVMITVTEGLFGVPRSKKVWANSPWWPELCQALRIERPFARAKTEARQESHRMMAPK